MPSPKTSRSPESCQRDLAALGAGGARGPPEPRSPTSSGTKLPKRSPRSSRTAPLRADLPGRARGPRTRLHPHRSEPPYFPSRPRGSPGQGAPGVAPAHPKTPQRTTPEHPQTAAPTQAEGAPRPPLRAPHPGDGRNQNKYTNGRNSEPQRCPALPLQPPGDTFLLLPRSGAPADPPKPRLQLCRPC